ncbi:MAG: hypothetical protein JOZ90_02400 [Alphaproteobacteria bacterium]|nr:hypothetical protein [Alphaproteobacteria bacterium]MBV9371197.1 hypothetical protein [Alphaproteobacteria bacterium]MBV9899927.1 hypothetical protein [Alphaproteobacteria bacterium]
MASASLGTAAAPARPGATLLACVAAEGSAAHPWPRSPALAAPPEGSRNLADLLHFLCILHGRYPGVVDHAADRTVDRGARAWLAEAAYAFAGERAYLARLAVAAGPLPSTPGAGDSDAAVLGQRHAIEMLACSERNGCALGAAMAVVLDWAAIRRALDAAAHRLGIEPPAYRAADPALVASVADAFAAAPPAGRALLFGAQQILVQHYGLWDLLETRSQARAAA